MEKWIKHLQSLGLSESETNVYLAVLKLGPQPVQAISKEVKLSRVTVYAAIESLTKLGLMTSVEKGKKQVYAAEPPERIVSLAENRVNSMKSTIQEIKNSIQELKLVQSGDKPVVKMFEGPEAFGAIQEDVLNSQIGRMMYEFGNLDEITRVYPYQENIRADYLKKLAKMPIERRLIFLTKNKTPQSIEANKKIKYLDESKCKFFGDIFVYGDTVWISSFKGKQITVMVKSQEIKDTFEAALSALWDSLP